MASAADAGGSSCSKGKQEPSKLSRQPELEKTKLLDRQRTERLLGMQHATTQNFAETVTLGEAIPKILRPREPEWQSSELWSVD